MQDREELRSNRCELTDRHISAANRLMRRLNPEIIGLDDPAVIIAGNFNPERLCCDMQIHNVDNHHWILSTYDKKTAAITVHFQLFCLMVDISLHLSLQCGRHADKLAKSNTFRSWAKDLCQSTAKCN